MTTVPRDEITLILTTLKSSSPGVQSVALTSIEGRTIVSTVTDLPGKVHLASLGAASIAIGKKASKDLLLGTLDRILIGGSSGSLLLIAVGSNTLLSIVIAGSADVNTVTRGVEQILTRLKALIPLAGPLSI